MSTGSFDREATKEVVKFATSKHADGIVIEIGANIGTQTVYANLEHRFARYIAIEPDPKNLSILKANLRLNGLSELVEVFPCALSNQSGNLDLVQTIHNSGASTVEKVEPDILLQDDVSVVSVVACKGDDLFSRLKIDPRDIALIWMDVEGHEAGVFEGMSATLECKPTIYFEYTPARLSSHQIDVVENLILTKYSNFYIYREGFIPLTKKEIQELKFTRSHVDLLVSA